MADEEAGFGTRAVHVGHEAEPLHGAVGTPVYQVSTFLHPRRRDADGHWVDNPDWIYTRWANPTVDALQRKMASLEGAEASLAFASGMAAISGAVLAHVGAGERMVAMADVYGGTYSLFENQVKALGVEVAWVRGASSRDVAEAVDEATRLVYVETPTNPFNRYLDAADLVARLEERFGSGRPPVVMDATFASPYNLRPLTLGVDVVVHSGTKYLNGHSDVIAGFASGSRQRIEGMLPWLRNLGASMDPNQAFLVARGMRTLALRMRAHNDNGQRVAEALEGHPAVERVWHLGLRSHPDHAAATSAMRGFGGIVSFELASGRAEDATRFVEGLRFFHAAPSLGGVESLATVPAQTSHSYLDDDELAAAGLSRSFVRLAVGVEDADDLVADVTQALDALA